MFASQEPETSQLARKGLVSFVSPCPCIAGVPGPADAVYERARPLRRDAVTRVHDLGEDPLVCAGDLGCFCRPVAEPYAQDVRIDREIPLRVPDSSSEWHLVIS